jgi:hypothetical protein
MSSGIGRPRLRIWLVALGLGGVVVGGAAGAVPDSAGVIHGCVDRQNRLTIIDTEAGQSCDRVASTPLDWNEAGPAGKGIKTVLITAVAPDAAAEATYDPATEQLSLKIPRGHDGANGINGTNGVDGKDGANGKDGADGKDGTSVTSVSVTTLDPGSAATSTFDAATGALTLGIPRGKDGVDGTNGKDGADGKDGVSVTNVTVSALDPNAAPTASFDPTTGTLALGIPRGQDGKDGTNGTNGKDGVDGKDGLGFSLVGNDYVLSNPGGEIKLAAQSFDVDAPAAFTGDVTVGGKLTGSSSAAFGGDVTTSGKLTANNVVANQGSINVLSSISLGTSSISAGTGIFGTLSATIKNFRIDDPLDPTNKWLYHSTVESSQMTNLYDGNVRTDVRGFATVQLPRWFQALNRDFKYQLTIVGHSFAQAVVWKELANNRFTIRTNQPRVEVSWQVTGVRHDAYAVQHPLQVEVPKGPADRGHLSTSR